MAVDFLKLLLRPGPFGALYSNWISRPWLLLIFNENLRNNATIAFKQNLALKVIMFYHEFLEPCLSFEHAFKTKRFFFHIPE